MPFISRHAVAIALMASSWSACAQAQTDAGNATADAMPPAAATETHGLAEIIVTAEKRSTNLQRTPIAVTALTDDTLQRQQIRALTDIASLVPGFQMGDSGGYAQITVRGIGISNFVPLAESAVALNTNEVYVSRPIAQLAGLYDTGSIEVLRGPQGTLYGRNATAGSVNVTTTRPTRNWSGYANMSYGNYNNMRLEGAVGGPLIDDKLLFRIAGFVETRDGYGKNIVTGRDVDDREARGIRGTIVFQPTGDIKATIIGEYYKQRDHGGGLHYFGAAGLSGLPGALGLPPLFQLLGGYSANDPYDIANGRDPEFMLRTKSLTGILEWSRGPFSLKSITGYRDQDSLIVTPLDGGSTYNSVFISGEPAHQFSEELQAHYDSSRVHLTLGGYVFEEHDDYSPATVAFSNTLLNLGFPTLPQRPTDGFVHFGEIGGRLKTKAKALFAQGTFEIVDGLSITGGIRYSSERKTLLQRYAIDLYQPYTGDNSPPPGVAVPGKTFHSTTPKIGIQYQITPRVLAYATYAKGFKSGGFDPGADPSVVAQGFRPEKLTDYEGGIKSSFLDNRVRLNLSGFYYDYSDLQVLQVVGVAVATSNAGSARIYGAEAELNAAVTSSLTINANAAWLHARYRRYVGPDPAQPLAADVDFSGKRLNNAPDFRAHIDAAYRWDLADGNAVFKIEGDYSSKIYFSPINIDLIGQKAYAKGNAFATYTANAGWHVTAFVRNFTDKAVRTSAIVNTPLVGNPVQGSYAPPRTYGIEIGYKF